MKLKNFDGSPPPHPLMWFLTRDRNVPKPGDKRTIGLERAWQRKQQGASQSARNYFFLSMFFFLFFYAIYSVSHYLLSLF